MRRHETDRLLQETAQRVEMAFDATPGGYTLGELRRVVGQADAIAAQLRALLTVVADQICWRTRSGRDLGGDGNEEVQAAAEAAGEAVWNLSAVLACLADLHESLAHLTNPESTANSSLVSTVQAEGPEGRDRPRPEKGEGPCRGAAVGGTGQAKPNHPENNRQARPDDREER